VVAGCATAEKVDKGPPRPVRFAVIAAPEVGDDDGDLALAVTRLSRERDLDFVLVPGPVLASDATAISLELLKNDLGQIAPPVYVAFSAASAVTSRSVASGTLGAEEILTALEGMGPGSGHAAAYHRSPRPGVVVNVLGPDGSSALDKAAPESTKRVIGLQASGEPSDRADVLVRPSPSGDVVVLPEDLAPPRPRPVTLLVPPLGSSKVLAVATVYPDHLDVEVVPLEGPPRGRMDPVPLAPMR
jgi:hypothetical protein